jgi:hypothetical protein
MIIKKAILKLFNSGSYTATVQIAGSSRAYLEGVKTSRNIPAVEMIAGRTVAVIFWDKNNPADAVIVGVYA